MILIRIACLMIFQNLFAYCQPVQLQNNPSGIVIEAPGILPDKIIFQTDTITETTTSIKSRTASKWPRVIIGQELFTNPGCNQSVINQIKSYFGFFPAQLPFPCSSIPTKTYTETIKTATGITTETITETATETTIEIMTSTPSVTFTESTSQIFAPPEINVLSYTYTSVFVSPPCHVIMGRPCIHYHHNREFFKIELLALLQRLTSQQRLKMRPTKNFLQIQLRTLAQ